MFSISTILKVLIITVVFASAFPLKVYATTPTTKSVILLSWGTHKLDIGILSRMDANRDDYIAIKNSNFSITDLRGAIQYKNSLNPIKFDNDFWLIRGKNFEKPFFLFGYSSTYSTGDVPIYATLFIYLLPFLIATSIFFIIIKNPKRLK